MQASLLPFGQHHVSFVCTLTFTTTFVCRKPLLVVSDIMARKECCATLSPARRLSPSPRLAEQTVHAGPWRVFQLATSSSRLPPLFPHQYTAAYGTPAAFPACPSSPFVLLLGRETYQIDRDRLVAGTR
jgi:hypothetical protein